MNLFIFIDGVYRHIDPLINRYLVDEATMRSKDMFFTTLC